MKQFFLITILLVVVSFSVRAQLRINEFLVSNTGDFIDPDYSESGDWIEIYNAGSSAANLADYYITDNLSDSIKWKVASDTIIAKGAYMVLWADGYNAGVHTSFKLSASGEEIGIYDLNGALIDSVTFGLQEPNISMGRQTDVVNWVFFIDPTPGVTNGESSFEGIVKSKPYFYPLGGIFSDEVSVEIKNLFNGEIRYTLDGSEPIASSLLYTAPISVNENTVIRARIFDGNNIPGSTITNSYFINDGSIGNLPVVSISTEPDNFWGEETGIYVQNFKPDWEVPINIELFENDGSDRAAFNEKAGTKVNGLFSWQLPQKMLGIYFRKEYGESKLEYPLFKNRDRIVFDSFTLRASGSDWSYTIFRDALGQYLTDENMDVDYQEYRPCVLYVNAEYMGIHNIRPKIDRDIVWYSHNLEGVDIDVIENENNPEEGTIDEYNKFIAAYSRDLTLQENYDRLLMMMDEENFTDFMIAEMYVRNSSLDHNVFAWKQVEGGEWRWIFGDLDRGFFNPTSSFVAYFENEGRTPFKALMRNTTYQQYFGRRIADQLFTTYDPNRVKSVIDQFQLQISGEIARHVRRWEGRTSSYGDAIPSFEYWQNQVNALKSFAEQRPVAILENIQDLGFGTPTPLSVAVSPESAGTVSFNGLKILSDQTDGAYFSDETIHLVAEAKAGYDFIGWGKATGTTIFDAGANWRYNDSGAASNDWNSLQYDASSWSVGTGQFGYGDNDETTTLGYGGDSSNKYISYYFRKSFDLANPTGVGTLKFGLMCDDGAVVYINGVEVARQSMPSGTIEASTLAISAIGGDSESAFTYYTIKGDEVQLQTKNVIAVEVHQAEVSSSDVSFDLSLTATIHDNIDLISEAASFDYKHTEATSLFALFKRNDKCVLPSVIAEELELDVNCSPYYVSENSTITENGNLIVPAGVELLFDDDISLNVHGRLTVIGTVEQPVFFRSNENSKLGKWGIVNIQNADTCQLNYLVVEDASKGSDRLTQSAAISIFNSTVKLDHLTIENVYANPVAARFSDVTMTNSYLHSEITGDLINIKYGKGLIENCEFEGNSMPDTDAIDYDDVENGVIRNVIIHNFNGFNSDAIDIGERAQNVLIENSLVYNITDKGVSVGQQSSANIRNSVFVNCNLGAGLKDSSKVTIDHCTYYSCVIPIACYEKNVGSAGGNAWVSSTILSNAYDESYMVDDYSFLTFMNSLSDSDTIRLGDNNLRANPMFEAPDYHNFTLLAGSPAINAGVTGNMGANLNIEIDEPNLVITGINYGEIIDALEYLILSNIGEVAIDISGYELNNGVSYLFGENVIVNAGENIFITNNASDPTWDSAISQVFQWDDGKLANEGEKVGIMAANGMMVDQVRYDNRNPWPAMTAANHFMALNTWGSDNHLGENWITKNLETVLLVGKEDVAENKLKLYPNPAGEAITTAGLELGKLVNILDIQGRVVFSKIVTENKQQFNISALTSGIYFVRSGNLVQKITKL